MSVPGPEWTCPDLTDDSDDQMHRKNTIIILEADIDSSAFGWYDLVRAGFQQLGPIPVSVYNRNLHQPTGTGG